MEENKRNHLTLELKYFIVQKKARKRRIYDIVLMIPIPFISLTTQLEPLRTVFPDMRVLLPICIKLAHA